jgi:16S rRNA (adenine1518-N6/adenine1519-N6)-dimethyltransferase
MAYPDARALLRKYGLRAKKSWGQNFLVDERAYQEILRHTAAGPEDTVIEIGAGLGTLTARLALVAARVVAVERDRDMAAILRAELGGNERVTIAEANALTVDYLALAADPAAATGTPLRPPIVVGNLPYQIASPILFRLLELGPRLSRVVVMLQAEMAERIVAAAGTPEYGAMSVMVQQLGAPKIVHRVAAGCFHPPPRVASAILRLEPLAAERAATRDAGWFSRVVHAAFQMRRKTLRNALRAVAEAAVVERGLAEAGIDGQRRGETLDVTEFARLADALLVAQLGATPPAGPAGGA